MEFLKTKRKRRKRIDPSSPQVDAVNQQMERSISDWSFPTSFTRMHHFRSEVHNLLSHSPLSHERQKTLENVIKFLSRVVEMHHESVRVRVIALQVLADCLCRPEVASSALFESDHFHTWTTDPVPLIRACAIRAVVRCMCHSVATDATSGEEKNHLTAKQTCLVSPKSSVFAHSPNPRVTSSLSPFSRSTDSSSSLPLKLEKSVRWLINQASDVDPMVRNEVLHSVSGLVAGGLTMLSQSMWQSLYTMACDRLDDDHAHVRSSALSNILVLSRILSSSHSSSSMHHTGGMRRKVLTGGTNHAYANDAFQRCCMLMGDVDAKVRTRAVQCAGLIQNVEEDILLGSLRVNATIAGVNEDKLNKQRKSQVSRSFKKDGHSFRSKARDAVAVGDVEVLDPSEKASSRYSILKAGLPGAFALELEDEVHFVREMTITSIGLQCKTSDAFFDNALPFLIHSCEDESERVRIHALDSIGTLIKQSHRHVVFSLQDLETILRGLGDLSRDVRKSTYELIGAVHVDDVDTLDHVVKRLSAAIHMYPDDRVDIFRCAFAFGMQEEDKLRVLFKKLLGIQDGVMTREPEKENMQYQVVLMVLLHLFKSEPHLEEGLPEYIPLHLEFVTRQFLDFGEDITCSSVFDVYSVRDSPETRLIAFLKHRIAILNEWLRGDVERDVCKRKKCLLGFQSLLLERDSMMKCVSSSSSHSFSSSVKFQFALLDVIHMRLKMCASWTCKTRTFRTLARMKFKESLQLFLLRSVPDDACDDVRSFYILLNGWNEEMQPWKDEGFSTMSCEKRTLEKRRIVIPLEMGRSRFCEGNITFPSNSADSPHQIPLRSLPCKVRVKGTVHFIRRDCFVGVNVRFPDGKQCLYNLVSPSKCRTTTRDSLEIDTGLAFRLLLDAFPSTFCLLFSFHIVDSDGNHTPVSNEITFHITRRSTQK
eukprot:TRINITY_DN1782_c0_g2_i2.p1 TRINITY_DN1782_c0_g2~~TRINITY_DN1782_c0_g2_i2.p1  ORF type:complete len:933 (+),score=223.09 TRINITY_DN1782_c0_g2_i2:72-2870(+)